MALPDYLSVFAGTAKVWKSSGGDYLLTLTSLANGSGREGAKGDLYDATYGLPEYVEIRFESQMTSTPTAGNEVELWIGESDNATAGTDNPGTLTGADAAVSSPNAAKLQCVQAGSLVLMANTNVQKTRMVYRPACRYVIPLVVNNGGVAQGSTAGNHVLVFTPYYRRVSN